MAKIRNYKVGDEPVPGYHLTAFLGSGGFGEVWRATAPGGTEVAIKVNNLGMKGALKEFRSLKLVKKIRYPNLVPILAIWLKNAEGELLAESAFEQVDGGPPPNLRETVGIDTDAFAPRPEPAELIIALGLAQKSLADRLEECKKQGQQGIPVDELLNYMQDAARAIDYLNSPRHELESDSQAIQHCDIKPPNILIVGDAAQVCDFGLARRVDDMRSTSLALSPVYAAPEMIETNVPSASTDQYSLAVSYLELRTGRLPFPPNSTAHTVIQAHLSGKLDLSALPPAEQEVVRRATSRKPADRFANTSEMVTALRRAVHPEGIGGSRRAWLGWAAACVTLAAGSSALGLAYIRGGVTPLVLPAGWIAGPNAKLVTVHNRSCPDQLICELHGLNLPFRLVHSRTATFYIMENKVRNQDYAAFAKANPAVVEKSKWRDGACGGKQDLSAAEHPQFPVYNVTGVEAALFARWLGGQLPTVEQWDEAAGRHVAPPPGEQRSEDRGPFQQPWDRTLPKSEQVAVGREKSGPLPAGEATKDISAYGCRDMSGNGIEWTRSTRDAAEQFLPDRPDDELSLIMRGRTYLHTEPLRFKDLEDHAQDDTRKCVEFSCDISFRVVRTFEDLH